MKIIESVALVLLLAGCMTEDQKASFHKQADVPLICTAGLDCDAKWRRSYYWIDEMSHWDVQKMTDSLIQTEGPYDTTEAAFTIKKVPNDDGTSTITFEAKCGNPILGCIPSELQLQASFVSYVNANSAQESPPENDADFGAEFTADASVAIVASVKPHTLAANAGLQPGDQVTRLNNRPVTTVESLKAILAGIKPGSVFPVEVVRNQKRVVVFARL